MAATALIVPLLSVRRRPCREGRGPADGEGALVVELGVEEAVAATGCRESHGRPEQRLKHPGDGFKPWPGLVTWTYHLEQDEGFLPVRIPPEVIDVYLTDARAQPDHECADCGLEVPVRPCVIDEKSFVRNVFRAPTEAEIRYFPVCPCCGGVTGLSA